MVTIFNSKTVYLGPDMAKFEEMRKFLESNKIKYKYKINDHNDAFMGNGTIRGNMGSFGNSQAPCYYYEILVTSKDAEKFNL